MATKKKAKKKAAPKKKKVVRKAAKKAKRAAPTRAKRKAPKSFVPPPPLDDASELVDTAGLWPIARPALKEEEDTLPAGWSRLWRSDRGIWENTCPHGIGHPSTASAKRTGDGTHTCDGCCAVFAPKVEVFEPIEPLKPEEAKGELVPPPPETT